MLDKNSLKLMAYIESNIRKIMICHASLSKSNFVQRVFIDKI